jgi:ABC-type lipoprotein release transport system permease subunit
MSRGALPGPLAWTLARRLLADPRSRLLHSSARAALLASTLGVAALGIALALMTGYREDLVRKLVGGNAAVLVDGRDLDAAADAELCRARRARKRRARGPRALLEGVLDGGDEAEVTLRAAPGAACWRLTPCPTPRRAAPVDPAGARLRASWAWRRASACG